LTDSPETAMANHAERARWNDEGWTAFWPEREALTSSITPFLMREAALQPGERVLDVGSGGGGTTINAAALVAPVGTVVGFDLSRQLVALARDRARQVGATNITFAVGDAQTDPIPGAPFDVVISQFGVMFFDHPVAAFANIRTQMRPGARLVFACWQSLQRNPWHTSPTLRPFVQAPPPWLGPADGPGPFRLADRADTDSILLEAGFTGMERQDLETVADSPATAVYNPAQLTYLGVGPAEIPAARAAIERHLAAFISSEGNYRFPVAFSICRATSP
jgi:SAM-dependent methyltransferase